MNADIISPWAWNRWASNLKPCSSARNAFATLWSEVITASEAGAMVDFRARSVGRRLAVSGCTSVTSGQRAEERIGPDEDRKAE